MGNPPGTALDDSIQKLGDFCSTLVAANRNLEEGTTVAENHAAEAHKLDTAVGEQFGGFSDELEAFSRDLDRDENEAVQQLEQTAADAHTMAESRLATVGQRLDTTEDALEQRLGAERDELDREFGELTANGFEPLQSTLEINEGEIDAVRTDIEGAYEQLETALQTMGTEMEEARARVVGALDQAARRAEGTEGPAFEIDAAAASPVVRGDAAGAGSRRRVACGHAGRRLHQFEPTATSCGRLLVESVATLGREQGEALITGPAQELDTAVGTLTTGVAEQVGQRMDEFGEGLDAAEVAVSTLDALVDDLEKVKTAIPQIAEALKELGP